MSQNLLEVTRREQRIDDNTTETTVDVDVSFWKLLGAVYVALVFIGGVAKLVAPANAPLVHKGEEA